MGQPRWQPCFVLLPPPDRTFGLSGACPICLTALSLVPPLVVADEQREEMWAAYIADKELLVEMLGVSACAALLCCPRQLLPLSP